MLHANASGAVTAHGVAGEAPAQAVGNGAIVGVDISHHVVGDKPLVIARRDGARIHRPAVNGVRVGQHDNHFLAALGPGALQRLGRTNVVGEPLRLVGKTVQSIDDRVAAVLLLLIAGRQKHERVAIDGVPFQIAFERRAVNLDVLNHGRLRARHNGRNFPCVLGPTNLGGYAQDDGDPGNPPSGLDPSRENRFVHVYPQFLLRNIF